MLLVNLCSSLLSLDYIQFVLITHQFICLWDTHNLRCMDLPSSTFLCVWRTYLLPHSTVSNPAVAAAVVACHRSISSPVLHLLYFLLRATVSTLAKMRNQGGVCVSLPLYLCVCAGSRTKERQKAFVTPVFMTHRGEYTLHKSQLLLCCRVQTVKVGG